MSEMQPRTPLGVEPQPELTAHAGASTILPPSLLPELEALAARLEHGPGVTHWARALAHNAGGATEFLDRRPYCEGDDMRTVDWHSFARTGRPVVKRFHAERAAELNVLLDLSASAAIGEPPKLRALKQLAAALTYLGAAAGARVTLWVGQGQLPLRAACTASSRRALPNVCGVLDGLRAEGVTLLVPWLSELCQHTRPGAIVVLSDLLSEGDLRGTLARARATGHEIALVHVLASQDVAPPIDGDATVYSVETHETLAVRFDFAAQQAYAARLARWLDELASDARQAGQVYVRAVAGQALSPVLRQYVASQLHGAT
jgi:uncharacterized protein (DUF58 family)